MLEERDRSARLTHPEETGKHPSMAKSFWDHPIEKIEEALSIRKQIDALYADLIGLIGGGEIVAESKTVKPARRVRRKMSAAARAKMSLAQKKRWAKEKRAKH